MRFFYDTEFIDNGRTIELISIGVAAEDGREYYACSTEFPVEQAGRWVRTHVLPKLPMTSLPPQIPRFARELRQFWEERGSPRMPPRPRDTHDALVDARHNLRRFQIMTSSEVVSGW